MTHSLFWGNRDGGTPPPTPPYRPIARRICLGGGQGHWRGARRGGSPQREGAPLFPSMCELNSYLTNRTGGYCTAVVSDVPLHGHGVCTCRWPARWHLRVPFFVTERYRWSCRSSVSDTESEDPEQSRLNEPSCPGMHWKGGEAPPPPPRPFEGAQSMPSSCLPDAKFQFQWHV